MSNVLIVEDSPSLALTFRLHLDKPGLTLFEADDGRRALDVLAREAIDLIVLDLNLPDINGIDILREVRRHPNPPAVVVVTARGSAAQAEASVAEGASDYLLKPFNGARLVTTVNNALTLRSLRDGHAGTRPKRTLRYDVSVRWTGNLGSGTSSYRAYDRDHVLSAEGRPDIAGSSDPEFRGGKTRWNPELLLVGSAAACHKLWYLHLCAEAGVVVTAYEDAAEGSMVETENGGGYFAEIVLRPRVTIDPASDAETARRLHEAAHTKCFIASSLNFPVRCEPEILVG
jgi:organic hydroperoxide reductase OsmC/OhrA/CheY-like chemotaxis protein